ncbi:ATP-grasp domain-containing protein [Streptomyces werraensis]|uniref:ATP-grasp domain-containing protein n=1 Tax=Streptomyces werraensis TaxID=68284 RepID=UPI0037F857F7
MTAPNGTVTLLCKWHKTVLEELLNLSDNVYVILDDFDVAHMSPDQSLLEKARKVYRVSSFDSVEELAAVAVDLHLLQVRVDRIVSHTEFSQYGAGYLELLLLDVEDRWKHTAYRDKRLMKERVRVQGVPTARYLSLAGPQDSEAAERVTAEFEFPVVVKPVSGFGTMSTVRVDRPADLPSVLESYSFESLLRGQQLMVEEFVEGDEICVDAFWADGVALSFIVHSYRAPRLAVTAKSRLDNDGLDGALVINEADEPDLYRRMRTLHDRINAGLGIAHGATHLEVFVRPDGQIVFSEIATRVGGGMMPRMLSAYLGRDIWADLAQVVVAGECLPAKPRQPYVGAVHITGTRPGLITSMPEKADLDAHPGILDWQMLREPGSKITLAHPSEWCLILVLGAESAQAYEKLRQEVIERFRVEVEQEEEGNAGK